jgi:NitT/TauT family transport system permease protein
VIDAEATNGASQQSESPADPDVGEVTRTEPSGRPLKNLALKILPPILLGIVLIGVWYFVSYGILDPTRQFLLRPPHLVVSVGFLEWDNLQKMLEGLWSTAKVAIIGFTIAAVIGIGLAILMSQSKLIERAVFPYAVSLQAVPILAIVPLIGFWFGYGLNSRVAICVIISLFPILVNSLFGLLSADSGLHDLLTLHHAGRWSRLRRLMFPAALPAIFAGLRISAGLSVVGAIVGDFFFGRGDRGIGQLLQLYANQLQGEELIAAIILSSAFGVSVFLLFGWIQERAIGNWYQPGSERT